MANAAWNFWMANSDEKEREKLQRDMYEPLAPLPFTYGHLEVERDYGGWSLGAWVPGEQGTVNRG